jgi:hypothetical protein
MIRVAGAIIGAIGFVVIVPLVEGLWGYAVGAIVFFGCVSISDRIWRNSASREDIRRDLEDRARDTSP